MSHGRKTIANPESTRKRIVRYMQSMGTYRTEFSDMITIFADLIYQYELAKREFYENGAEYETTTSSGGSKKSGTVTAMEQLRVQIGTYSDRLMLNPKAFDKNESEQTGIGSLEKIFKGFE